jgi:hypothetical protein
MVVEQTKVGCYSVPTAIPVHCSPVKMAVGAVDMAMGAQNLKLDGFLLH